MSDRQAFVDALNKLPDVEFEHVVALVKDVAVRLPEHAFRELAEVGEGKTIEYTPPDNPAQAGTKTENDVTVAADGVTGVSEKGGVG